MICYFSGTGNSRHVAARLAALLGEQAVSVYDKKASEAADEPAGIVFPVYAWGVPMPVVEFIRHRFRGRECYAVMTCGDETGDAPKVFRKLCADRGVNVLGVWSVQMPNVYVLLPGFDVDPKELERRKLEACGARIGEIAGRIRAREWRDDYVAGPMASLKTRLVYPLFKHWGIYPQRWRAGEGCTGCGVCERLCPQGNIRMKNGKPEWGKECVSCVACYHGCPAGAIDYASATKRKGHYRPKFPK